MRTACVMDIFALKCFALKKSRVIGPNQISQNEEYCHVNTSSFHAVWHGAMRGFSATAMHLFLVVVIKITVIIIVINKLHQLVLWLFIQSWRPLANYTVKAGVVCLQVKLCDLHLSALEMRFSRRGAIQFYVYLYLYSLTQPGRPSVRTAVSVWPIELVVWPHLVSNYRKKTNGASLGEGSAYRLNHHYSLALHASLNRRRILDIQRRRHVLCLLFVYFSSIDVFFYFIISCKKSVSADSCSQTQSNSRHAVHVITVDNIYDSPGRDEESVALVWHHLQLPR